MTIDEAIELYEKKAKSAERSYTRGVWAGRLESLMEVATEHRQLATWLKELKEALELIQEYKAENVKLREFNDKIYDVLAKQFGSPCNCNYVVDEYMRKNGGCDDCGVEISDKECWSRYIQTKLIGENRKK